MATFLVAEATQAGSPRQTQPVGGQSRAPSCQVGRPARSCKVRAHGTTLTAPAPQPDPRLGTTGPHRRLDRPSARGDGPADRDVQEGQRPRARRPGQRRGRARLRQRDRPARRGRRARRRRAGSRRGQGRGGGRALAEEEAEAARGPRPARRTSRRRADAKPARAAAGAAAGAAARAAAAGALEGTFDHGEEGYGLWLDPAVADNPVYAEHWAGHRPVEVTVEEDQIVIRRAGADERRLSAADFARAVACERRAHEQIAAAQSSRCPTASPASTRRLPLVYFGEPALGDGRPQR